MVNLVKKVNRKIIDSLLIFMLVMSFNGFCIDTFAEEVISEATVKVVNPTYDSSMSTEQTMDRNSHAKTPESKQLPKTNERFVSGNVGILLINMVIIVIYVRKLKYKKSC